MKRQVRWFLARLSGLNTSGEFYVLRKSRRPVTFGSSVPI